MIVLMPLDNAAIDAMRRHGQGVYEVQPEQTATLVRLERGQASMLRIEWVGGPKGATLVGYTADAKRYVFIVTDKSGKHVENLQKRGRDLLAKVELAWAKRGCKRPFTYRRVREARAKTRKAIPR